MTSKWLAAMKIKRNLLMTSTTLYLPMVSSRFTLKRWRDRWRLREKKNFCQQMLLVFQIGCISQPFSTLLPTLASLKAMPSPKYSAFGRKTSGIATISRLGKSWSVMSSFQSLPLLRTLWKSTDASSTYSKTRLFLAKSVITNLGKREISTMSKIRLEK